MRNTTSAAREQKLLLLVAFVCGLLHHWMFYGRTWGLQYPLFVLLLYSLYFWALRDRVRLRLEASSSLWIPVILLSLTFAVHANLLFLILNALAVPALMAVHTYWMSRPMPAAGLNARFIRELIEQVVVQTLRYIPEPFKVLFRGISERIQPGRSRILGKVLLGLLLSAPVLGVVVTLLSSADTVFNHTLTRRRSGWTFHGALLCSVRCGLPRSASFCSPICGDYFIRNRRSEGRGTGTRRRTGRPLGLIRLWSFRGWTGRWRRRR
ncbi:hypothetical protein LJK88_45035 [Paenibacillus sp. P26]|nr:hypothetical protein LJK88_45035 [Paenibacillus sp. P26]